MSPLELYKRLVSLGYLRNKTFSALDIVDDGETIFVEYRGREILAIPLASLYSYEDERQ